MSPEGQFRGKGILPTIPGESNIWEVSPLSGTDWGIYDASLSVEGESMATPKPKPKKEKTETPFERFQRFAKALVSAPKNKVQKRDS